MYGLGLYGCVRGIGIKGCGAMFLLGNKGCGKETSGLVCLGSGIGRFIKLCIGSGIVCVGSAATIPSSTVISSIAGSTGPTGPPLGITAGSTVPVTSGVAGNGIAATGAGAIGVGAVSVTGCSIGTG